MSNPRSAVRRRLILALDKLLRDQRSEESRINAMKRAREYEKQASR